MSIYYVTNARITIIGNTDHTKTILNYKLIILNFFLYMWFNTFLRVKFQCFMSKRVSHESKTFEYLWFI